MSTTLTAAWPNTAVHQRKASVPRRRSAAEALAPLDELAKDSPNIIVGSAGSFESAGAVVNIPRYLFIGPKGGDAPIRVGIFAGIHGDEPETSQAIVRFVRLLETHANAAQGYTLSIYPVCNPTGFADGSRLSRSGADLNREFWKDSFIPEVKIIEHELDKYAFHGIVSIHMTHGSQRLSGWAGGSTLTTHLVGPAIEAANALLPAVGSAGDEGSAQQRAILGGVFPGALSARPEVRPRPFELVFAAPKGQPDFVTECAFTTALLSVLTNYRNFIAHARHV